jgi:peptidoglycan hydrolase CwlO-like protein|tara:strand:+ start:9301 stop:9507 length:207 start_codon:yes stop_codon:yes gene_type:complete
MPKTIKPKNDPGKSYSVTDTLVEIDAIVETIEEIQNNMDVLNRNMQGSIDEIKELTTDMNKIKKRMGL